MMSRSSSSSSRVSVGSSPIIAAVGRQRARPEPEHEPAPGEVIQQDRPLGHPQRVVVAHD